MDQRAEHTSETTVEVNVAPPTHLVVVAPPKQPPWYWWAARNWWLVQPPRPDPPVVVVEPAPADGGWLLGDVDIDLQLNMQSATIPVERDDGHRHEHGAFDEAMALFVIEKTRADATVDAAWIEAISNEHIARTNTNSAEKIMFWEFGIAATGPVTAVVAALLSAWFWKKESEYWRYIVTACLVIVALALGFAMFRSLAPPQPQFVPMGSGTPVVVHETRGEAESGLSERIDGLVDDVERMGESTDAIESRLTTRIDSLADDLDRAHERLNWEIEKAGFDDNGPTQRIGTYTMLAWLIGLVIVLVVAMALFAVALGALKICRRNAADAAIRELSCLETNSLIGRIQSFKRFVLDREAFRENNTDSNDDDDYESEFDELDMLCGQLILQADDVLARIRTSGIFDFLVRYSKGDPYRSSIKALADRLRRPNGGDVRGDTGVT